MERYLKRLSAWCMLIALILVLTLTPLIALADSQTMSFEDFVSAVISGNGTFDGKGVTIKWEPNEKVSVIHRIQNNNAQYQLFGKLRNLNISNVHFEYVPRDIPNHSDGWNGLNKDWTAAQIRNAEFQFLNSGNVTITGCSFEKIIVSPYGATPKPAADAETVSTISGCTFRNVYNAYAIKDIYTESAVISGNTFIKCSGGIYFEGAVERGALTIENNTFQDMDLYAAASKENTRGLIQFSSACNFISASSLTVSGSQIVGNQVIAGPSAVTGLPVVRLLCRMNGMMINGWTPGAPFSVKAEKAGLSLPDMPSGVSEGIAYTFAGWARKDDYLGPTSLINAANFLEPGAQTAQGTFYYAVWQTQSNDAANVPHTGDTSRPILWIALTVFSGAGLVILLLQRRLKSRTDSSAL